MVIIKKGLSFSQIIQANIREIQQIKKILSFYPHNYQYIDKFKQGLWDGKINLINWKNKTFPAGLTYLVKKHMPEIMVQYDYEQLDYNPNPKLYKSLKKILKGNRDEFTKYFPPEKNIKLEQIRYQLKAFKVACNRQQGLFSLATNAGKTFIEAIIAQAFKHHKCIIFVRRVDLFNQLYEDFSRLLNIKIGKICSHSKIDLDSNIVLAMVPTLIKRVITQEDIANYYENTKVIISDECHHSLAKNETNLIQNSNAFVKLGFSGTISTITNIQNTGYEDGIKLRGIFGPVLMTVRNKKLIKAGISATPKVHLIEFEHKPDNLYYQVYGSIKYDTKNYTNFIYRKINYNIYNMVYKYLTIEKKDEKNIYKEELEKKLPKDKKYETRVILKILCNLLNEHDVEDLSFSQEQILETCEQYFHRSVGARIFNLTKQIKVVNNTSRNKIIKQYVNKCKGQTLIIVDDVKLGHGTKLEKLINNSKFICGQTKLKERDNIIKEFKNKDLGTLITSSIFDEGMDVPNIHNLFLVSISKKDRLILQRIGRGLREKMLRNILNIYSFIDFGDKILLQTSKQLFKIYRNEGFDIYYE